MTENLEGTEPVGYTISLSRSASGPDGSPGSVTETVTSESLAELIEPAMTYAMKVMGPHATPQLLARIAADRIIHPQDLKQWDDLL